jgi:hypothetical protein
LEESELDTREECVLHPLKAFTQGHASALSHAQQICVKSAHKHTSWSTQWASLGFVKTNKCHKTRGEESKRLNAHQSDDCTPFPSQAGPSTFPVKRAGMHGITNTATVFGGQQGGEAFFLIENL